jgi:hypothetical protein
MRNGLPLIDSHLRILYGIPTTRQLNRSSQALPKSTSIKFGLICFAPL